MREPADLCLKGDSEFKGRNGYARLARMSTVCLQPTMTEPWSRTAIEFWSQRYADAAPASLWLRRDDLIAFKEWVAAIKVPEL